MKSRTKRVTTLMLGCLLSCPWNALASVQAQSLKEARTQQQALKPSKLAPDLEVLLADDDEEQRQKLQGKTLAQIRQERRSRVTQRAREEGEEAPLRQRINGILLPSSEAFPEEQQSFIVQINDNTPNVVWQEKLALMGGRIQQQLNQIGLVTIEAPRKAIRQLAAQNSIAYVSPDRPVAAQGHLETTTGATLVRSLISGQTLDGSNGGNNIGVAILDSGFDQNHNLLRSSNGHPGIVGQKDCVGAGIYLDSYGHGSHVGTIVMGSSLTGAGKFQGIAPGAKIVNVVVLNSDGKGTASNVINGLDWIVANKSAYNIRVINLSLGTIAKDSYTTDPLCLAARRAVNAGIVVVASAGNNGKNSAGQKIYGAINAPGNDPSVITVGAVNSYGTDTRSDDTVATYSSRGPTRSYKTVNGVRKYDNLIKPDLVAPGNKIVGARSNNYNNNGNKLTVAYPGLLTGTATSLQDTLMYMSGTSMAAPVVAGAATLMLQANSKLTPSLVKAILMYTAQPLNGFNMLEQGAGELNIDGAVRLARLVKTTLPTRNGEALLTASLPSQQSTIAGQSFKWGQGVITNYGFLSGSNLMTYWQSVYGAGQVLGDATTYANGAVSLVSGKTYNISLLAGAYKVNGSGLILGDSANSVFSSGQVLGDGTIIGDGTILGDGTIIGDGTILGDGTTRADSSLKSDSGSAILGDNTSCMKP